MYAGKIVEQAPAKRLFGAGRHRQDAVHPGAARRDPAPGAARAHRAARGQRPAAGPDRAAARLLVRAPLPGRRRRLHGQGAGAGRARAGPPVGLLAPLRERRSGVTAPQRTARASGRPRPAEPAQPATPAAGKKPLLVRARPGPGVRRARGAAAPGAASSRRCPACRSTSCPARPSASWARPARASPPSPAPCCRRRAPSPGSVVFRGTGADQAARPARCCRPGGDMQFVWQDPFGSLDPKWQVRSIVEEPLVALLGRQPRQPPQAGRRAARPGRPGPGQVRQAAPARAVRRPGAAGRHRPRRRPRAVAAHLRRGGLLARRADPGAGAQPVRAAAPRARACPTCSSRTTWPWSSRSATGSR